MLSEEMSDRGVSGGSDVSCGVGVFEGVDVFEGVEVFEGFEVFVGLKVGGKGVSLGLHAERTRLDANSIEEIQECRLITFSLSLLLRG